MSVRDINYDRVKKAIVNKGYVFFNKKLSINIVGIRCNNSDNKFTDYMCVLWVDKDFNDNIEVFPCTTKAGKHWLLYPLNINGTAILKEGQYRGAYKIGYHNRTRPSRKYRALEQVSDMRYVRDNNKDDVHDYDGIEYVGNFKTNIHRAGKSGWSRFVDKWSAGCQVISGINESRGCTNWDRFMFLCDRSAAVYGNKFTYTLLNEKDL